MTPSGIVRYIYKKWIILTGFFKLLRFNFHHFLGKEYQHIDKVAIGSGGKLSSGWWSGDIEPTQAGLQDGRTIPQM